MSDALDLILQQPTGARFYRADLHIHSVGASHDVKDKAMTPAAIVATAITEGLGLIAITDHNEISNVEAALKAAAGKALLVVPGVELSTPQGHLLCYLPTLGQLQKFYGKLSIAGRNTGDSRCQESMLDCLNMVGELGGFGILAHVDAPAGYEIEVPKASPHKFDVICHPALQGIELKQVTSPISYFDGDPVADRARMGKERIQRLGLGSKQMLARVLNSDAHALAALGRNAANDRKVTRFKMETPTFDALRVALGDADARVRIEDQIPTAVPRVLGVSFQGGFLDGQTVAFSPNLNCFIGGRGTGKSTMFEAVRCLTDDTGGSGVVDSEVWPDELHLCWQDKSGEKYTVRRLKDSARENIDDPDFGPDSFEVDCFGQGEAAQISHEAKTNPLTLLNYLDKFVELADAPEKEEAARNRLLALQTDIEKAEQNVAQIPQYERALATTRKQLEALRQPEVAELIELQREVASERELRTQIAGKLQEIRENVAAGSSGDAVDELLGLAEPGDLSVGVQEFTAIVKGATDFSKSLGTAQSQINASLVALEKVVTAQFAGWKSKENEAQKRIDVKRRELEALKVTFDMAYITKLARDEASHDKNVKTLKNWVPHLAELRKQRTAALKERWETRARIAGLRDAYGRKASGILRDALTDLQVSLKYVANAHSPEAENQIIQIMGWRTNQQVRANYLVEQLTIPILLDAIRRKNPQPILDLETREGFSAFEADEAGQIIDKLGEPAVMFALERVMLHDLPRLTVAREVTDHAGKKKTVVREFSKLSLGQQQSVLLALMLSADSDKPLIIDQPEDNLDGEFIYSTLVPILRRAKERRQVIIVTHNPNVAVLGDAEQIVVMKARNDHGEIVSRGSVDHGPTRDLACAILEGAREAFVRRARMYGIELKKG